MPRHPQPNTVPSLGFLTLGVLGWVFVFWVPLFSATIRDWIFENTEELEESGLGWLVGGAIAAIISAVMIHRIWELWSSAPKL